MDIFLRKGKETEERATKYCVIKDKHYKSSFSGPLLKCLRSKATLKVKAEMYEGYYENHSKGRAMAKRIMLQGFYWPTMLKNFQEYAKRCEKCQKFASIRHVPSNELMSIFSTWPFIQWQLDIVGRLPIASVALEEASERVYGWLSAEDEMAYLLTFFVVFVNTSSYAKCCVIAILEILEVDLKSLSGLVVSFVFLRNDGNILSYLKESKTFSNSFRRWFVFSQVYCPFLSKELRKHVGDRLLRGEELIVPKEGYLALRVYLAHLHSSFFRLVWLCPCRLS
ncbi:hypothetical protein FEM48_Zijuj03G0101500 [Ziziphus jujuba var. spinosa]|uniref:Integrase zinc-binding domain-containing protein n=1 Tax=Ziziphus jujuba var. spinosa TaxID=714518 RepID=A0A978VPP3_ZIZJJ|nr:hypothetical protein FEM48_Zijuj03G0101500 [Ziziphus jujuba var. spinosa]